MSWYEFLLFVHVTCAAIWLGGALFVQLYAVAVRRGGDPVELGTYAGRVGVLTERLFAPASMLLLLAGIGLMIEGSWGWGQLWVVFALAAFAGSFAVGFGVLSPMAKRLATVGAATAEGQELIRRIFAISRLDLLFIYAVLFAMTVKPTGEDGVTVAVAAAVLAVLTLWFARGLRGGSAADAVPATD